MNRQEWILLIISIILGLIFTLCVILVLVFAFGGIEFGGQSTNDEWGSTTNGYNNIVESLKDSSEGFFYFTNIY